MNKTKSMEWAESVVEKLNTSPDRKYIVHRSSRPVTDLKNVLTTSAALYGENVLFRQRFIKGGAFECITYNEALDYVNALGTALLHLGLKDKRIAVIGSNCSQWAISYLAVVCGAGVVVPLDKELGGAELCQLCESADVSAVIFESKYEKIFREMSYSDGGRPDILVAMDNIKAAAVQRDDGVLSLAALIEKGRTLIAEGDRSYIDAQIDPEVMSILIFTSGTTGIAKGVMLSHKNICFDLMISPTLLEVRPTDIFFSVLPIHHTYECTSGFLMPLYKGASIAYCEGLKYIQKNLKEVQPTMFLGVPLLFEKLYKGIWNNIRKEGKEASVKKLMAVCGKLGKPGLALQKKLLKPVYEVFGSRMRCIISGGAAIDPAILGFFNDLGFISVQGYGLTECAPMAALNPDDHKKLKAASVGHLMPCMEAKIKDADSDGIGEICLKGDNIMLGYYNMPEESSKVLADGWFMTGDLGYIDEDDFIYITGRQKNVIITANGKNVFPEELEYYLGKILYVEESMVWADKDESGNDTVITASIYPSKSKVEEVCGEYSPENAEKLIWAELDKINEELPLFKRIKKLVIRNEAFVKTTGQKIKRFEESNKEK